MISQMMTITADSLSQKTLSMLDDTPTAIDYGLSPYGSHEIGWYIDLTDQAYMNIMLKAICRDYPDLWTAIQNTRAAGAKTLRILTDTI